MQGTGEPRHELVHVETALVLGPLRLLDLGPSPRPWDLEEGPHDPAHGEGGKASTRARRCEERRHDLDRALRAPVACTLDHEHRPRPRRSPPFG